MERYSQARDSFILYNTVQGAWINRMADNLTTSMWKAMWFDNRADAEHWLMEGIYAPVDKLDFRVMRTVTTIQEVPDEHLSKTD